MENKLKIIYKNPADLISYKLNAKTHPTEQIKLIKYSIDTFNADQPIVIDEKGIIIKGHGRKLAAMELGITSFPCIVRSDLTDQEKRAARLADNRSAESPLDSDILTLELEDLDINLDDIGFDDSYLDSLGIDLDNIAGMGDNEGQDTEPQISKADELKEKWGTETGQLWILGKHKLICGDCTDPEVISRLMDGEKADLCLTDPPYGIKRDKGFGGSGGFGKPIPRRNYNDEWDSERPDKSFFDILIITANKLLIFGGNFFADILPQSTHWIVWDKLNTMPTFGDCELIWTNVLRNSVKKYTFEYNGLIGKEKERYHPTQKPVKLISEILSDYSKETQIIIDPFLGSGTTLIACENLNRHCRGAEIDPGYCAVILERFYEHTGEMPVTV